MKEKIPIKKVKIIMFEVWTATKENKILIYKNKIQRNDNEACQMNNSSAEKWS